MKRDPKERFIKIHMDSISVKRVKSRFFWHRCEKCRQEFRREPMYECECLDEFSLSSFYYYFGCTNCFSDKDKFVEWLQDTGRVYTNESLERWYRTRYE
jgi:hypothetical protein